MSSGFKDFVFQNGPHAAFNYCLSKISLVVPEISKGYGIALLVPGLFLKGHIEIEEVEALLSTEIKPNKYFIFVKIEVWKKGSF